MAKRRRREREDDEVPSLAIVSAVLGDLAIRQMRPDGSYNVTYGALIKELVARGFSAKASEEALDLAEGARGPFAGRRMH
jgi:hypothetical protein